VSTSLRGFIPSPLLAYPPERFRKILRPSAPVDECNRAMRQRAERNPDASRSRPGKTSRTAFGRRQNVCRTAGDLFGNQYLISRRYRNRRYNLRTRLRHDRRPLKALCSGRAAWKIQVCRSRQSFRRRDSCPCKSTLSVRRYEQRSLLDPMRPSYATSPLR